MKRESSTKSRWALPTQTPTAEPRHPQHNQLLLAVARNVLEVLRNDNTVVEDDVPMLKQIGALVIELHDKATGGKT